WLDGPTALAAVLNHSGDMTLATTVVLPVVRGPVATAKSLAAIDRLSGGRALVAVGPGSSPLDYDAAGIAFDERWARREGSARASRSLGRSGSKPFEGRFYRTEGLDLEPRPTRTEGPPIWIGSWGSDAGLRRVARLGDGWLASAYNTTPALFADAWTRLGDLLADNGKDPQMFPNSLATMWYYITEDRTEADVILRQRVAPSVNRSEGILRERLPIGSAGSFAELLGAYKEAGLQRVLLWPVADETRQLELFREKVATAI